MAFVASKSVVISVACTQFVSRIVVQLIKTTNLRTNCPNCLMNCLIKGCQYYLKRICSKSCGRTLFLAQCASRFLNYYETIVSCLSMM